MKTKRRELLTVIGLALLFRFLIYFIYFVLMLMSDKYPGGIGFEDYLEAWNRWDAPHYLDIAEFGYEHYEEGGQHLFLVFLPLYPWLIKLPGMLIGNYKLAGLLVSTVCFVVGCVYLYLTVRDEYGSKTAWTALCAISIFPFSFFFGGIMTESLFFAIAAAFMYYLRRHKYVIVTLLGLAACLTKLQGSFLSLAILFELAQDSKVVTLVREKRIREVWSQFLWPGIKCIPMLLGVGIYLLINLSVEGNAFAFMKYQEEHWGHTVGPIWNTIGYMFGYLTSEPGSTNSLCIWWPQMILFFVLIAAIIYGIATRMRLSFLAYLVAFFLVTYSSTWLISGARYTIVILPLFVLIGHLINRFPKAGYILAPASMSMTVIYMWAYFNWMQIM